MSLSRDYGDTVAALADSDPEFRSELLNEALIAFDEGDVLTGKMLLKDYTDAMQREQAKLREALAQYADRSRWNRLAVFEFNCSPGWTIAEKALGVTHD